MKNRLSIEVLIIFCLSVFLLNAGQIITNVNLPKTILSQSSSTTHPRLFFTTNDIPVLKQKITTGRSLAAFNLMKNRADSYLNLVTSPYVFNGAISGRALEVQLLDLALTGYLTDNSNYTNKAIEIMCAVAQQSDVNTFNTFNTHLAVGDMAHTYAIAYDWLEPYLDTNQKQLIEDEIYSFGKWLYDNSLIQFWGAESPRRLAHNHQAVTHGALGLCGLVLGDKAPAGWVNRAQNKITNYFDYAVDSTGCAYEGMSYLAYGLQHAIPFAEALRRGGGSDIVMEKSVTKYIPEYYMWQLLPGGAAGVMLNQSENTMKPAGGVMYLVSRHQNSVALWGWDRMVGNTGDKSYGRNAWLGAGASLPYVILWEDQQLQPLSPVNAGLSNDKYFERGQVSSRDGWDNHNSFVTFTCGFGWNGCWNHGDVGSFTLNAKGENFVIDPGPSLTKTIAHSAITVNGAGQDWLQNGSAPTGKITVYRNDTLTTYIKGDATTAYQQLIPSKKVVRQLLYVRNKYPYLIITDDFELKTPIQKNFQWRLTTHFGNNLTIDQIQNNVCIVGASGNAELNVECLYPETFSLSQNSDPNSKYKQLVITSATDRGKFIVVLFATDVNGITPVITQTGDVDNKVLNIDFGDGVMDSIRLNLDNIEFKRNFAPAGLHEKYTDLPLTVMINEDKICIKGEVGKNASAIMYDISGRIITTQMFLQGNINFIPVSDIKKGMYLLQIMENNRKKIEKILVK